MYGMHAMVSIQHCEHQLIIQLPSLLGLLLLLGLHAGGGLEWRQLLHSFWGPFHATVIQAAAVKVAHVFDVLDQELGEWHMLYGAGGAAACLAGCGVLCAIAWP